jgi:hypothetical protein
MVSPAEHTASMLADALIDIRQQTYELKVRPKHHTAMKTGPPRLQQPATNDGGFKPLSWQAARHQT